MTNIRRMFFGGNTVVGFYSLHNNIVNENRRKLYILKGMPGGGKSSLMKKIGEQLLNKNFTVEFHHCPTDPSSLDSIFIWELKTAIVDGTAPHIIEPVYPGLKDELIELAQFVDKKNLKLKEKEIIEAKAANKRAYFNVFSYLKAVKHIHDIIVEKNRHAVDFEKVNKKTKLIIDEIFSKKEMEVKNNIFKERHAFAAANSPKGLVDYTDTILKGIGTVYYVKGEKGTGKSTLIKKIYQIATIKDYTVEVYRNAIFPEKYETLIVKELDTCITSNENGEKYTTNIVDLNEFFNEKVIDRKDYEIYKLLMEKATLSLKEASKNHNIMENIYTPTIDYRGINKIKDNLLKEILSLA